MLEGKVALVTGGTRNVGKGISQALCDAGATVYVTGRSIKEKDTPGIAIVCDHTNDEEVKKVFERIQKEQGKLDILVNNAWGGYNRLRNRKKYKGFKWKELFWKQPLELWDEMNDVGVRSNYVASVYASQMMVSKKGGLIVNISFYAARRYYGNVAYGVAKAAVDKMSADMSVELKPYNVTCLSLYPGYISDNKKKPNPKKESSVFVGRAISALASDKNVIKKTGRIQVVAELAKEYDFKDIDGIQPVPYDSL